VVEVVHAVVLRDGRVALWAERALPHALASRRGAKAVPHPFAGDPPAPGEPVTLTLHLPTAGSRPLASPQLGAPPPTRGEIKTLPWLVSAAIVTDFDGVPADAVSGPSVAFLAAVRDLADDLVLRGRVLPALTATQEARWQPVLVGADATRFGELRRLVPPVCRSATGDSTEATLHAVLGAMVDALVRERLAGTRADGWLSSLVDDPRVAQDQDFQRALGDALAGWHHATVQRSPVRTVFRLSHLDEDPELPPDQADAWLVEFLLQPHEDPSVLVPAAQMWADGGLAVYAFADDPQHQLLADLGRASRLYPGLDAALHDRHPAELELDTEGAYEFLRHTPLLAGAGFGVLLPTWWQRPVELGLSLTVHTGQTAGVVMRDRTVQRSSLADFRWEIALGDQVLSEAELRELAAAKVPLVRLRGRWVYLDAGRLAKGLAFLRRGGVGQISAGEALRRVWRHPDDETDLPLPVTAAGGDGWLGDLLAGRLAEHLELLDPPPGLTAVLRPYQRRGLSWLAFLDRLGIGACLADDMGLGKTIQLLALEAHTRQGERRPPTLVVCPLSVLGNWRREAARFTPGLSVSVYHGAGRTFAPSGDIVLTTYATVARDAGTLRGVEWDRVVLDEAQHIKNSASAVSQAVRKLRARHRVALTGTPVENRLAELWSIVDFLNPGILGTVNTFRARYSVPVERFGDEAAAARLRRVTRPLLLRRLKTDRAVISDLPDKRETRQLCTLTVEQATLYRAVVDEMFLHIDEGRRVRRKGIVLAAMTKLKQVCDHPAQLLRDGSPLAGRSGKLDRLEEILEHVLERGEKALVFTQFARFGGMLAPHLAATLGCEVLYLHGGTPTGERDALVERFQTSPSPGVFILSLKAGGTGLNLTAANHVVHFDRWWNPAVEAQATDRAFRIGQGRDVFVHTFLSIGTVEERIDELINSKSTLLDLAVGGGESWLTELSTSDLRALVALSPEAVGE
jgi:superfamily II DNA or RNA helicase